MEDESMEISISAYVCPQLSRGPNYCIKELMLTESSNEVRARTGESDHRMRSDIDLLITVNRHYELTSAKKWMEWHEEEIEWIILTISKTNEETDDIYSTGA